MVPPEYAAYQHFAGSLSTSFPTPMSLLGRFSDASVKSEDEALNYYTPAEESTTPTLPPIPTLPPTSPPLGPADAPVLVPVKEPITAAGGCTAPGKLCDLFTEKTNAVLMTASSTPAPAPLPAAVSPAKTPSTSGGSGLLIGAVLGLGLLLLVSKKKPSLNGPVEDGVTELNGHHARRPRRKSPGAHRESLTV